MRMRRKLSLLLTTYLKQALLWIYTNSTEEKA